MKKWFLFTLSVLVPLLVRSQSTKQIVIGQIDSLTSKILHEKRKLWVHVPDSYRQEGSSKRRYSVVYLLDGESHFPSVVGMIHQLSTVNGNTICPEMIVVGIPNTNRFLDLTPTPGGGMIPSAADSTRLKNSGGGEKFTAFIESELIPHMDSLYPTEPYKIFIGHSLGGLLVINTLIHHPNLFNAYVAIDPSMWWANQQLLHTAQQVITSQKYAGKALFVGIANTMESGMDTLRVQTDTSGSTKHIRSILALDRLLKATRQTSLRYQGKYYALDDHSSVPLIAEYDALRFIFDFYRLTLTDQDYEEDNTGLADKLTTHFRAATRQLGYTVKPPESLVNELGSYMVSQQKFKKAGSLFKLNVANYPASFNACDSYGDYFVTQKDTVRAIANFQKALSLKEASATRKKLVALQAQSGTHLSPANKPKN
ncbi:alpha/beta hydrolase [Spirosoma pollinicola]|uniref:Esterase n=1 Tax=Spirosoma pollinicola TaxID=2057025 RepID=A0A2K8YT85_9BACT|nr:alpha/beta hydrolase-fold protein [Spirosoma pollinicola]AUD00836.1 esterase [Spirosoma pollinicola]